MNKQKIIPFSALALLLAGGTIVGVGKVAPAHAQTSTAQNQVTHEVPDEKPTEAAEPAKEQSQEKNLPGGGHQDMSGNVDHQFEGAE